MTDGLASVDVVILSLDRPADTADAIASVAAQQGVQTFLRIVDQGSTAESLEYIRAAIANETNVHLIELGHNVGVAGGRNIGMSLGTADTIISIDNDAVFSGVAALQAVVDRFETDRDLGAVGFKILNYRTREYDRGSWAYPRRLLPRQNESFLTTRFCGAGHAIRRSALRKTNMYDERLFFYWEELDLSYQLISKGYKILYDPSIEVLHKISSEARTAWDGERFYYLVRNALYLEYKYFRSGLRLVPKAGGYLLKGIYNGLADQAIRGIRDSWKMISSADFTSVPALDADARRYLVENEMKYRGPFIQRLREEVFEPVGR
ncbi:MAG: glycosyltransferase family 2 protein [Anaerolineales bacterium]